MWPGNEAICCLSTQYESVWDARKNELYGGQDGETSGCSCPLTGDFASSAHVCGCVVDGVIAMAAT